MDMGDGDKSALAGSTAVNPTVIYVEDKTILVVIFYRQVQEIKKCNTSRAIHKQIDYRVRAFFALRVDSTELGQNIN